MAEAKPTAWLQMRSRRGLRRLSRTTRLLANCLSIRLGSASRKDKARMENQVPYVRENWFEGESFASLDDARRSAEHRCRHTAGERIHGTTRKMPYS